MKSYLCSFLRSAAFCTLILGLQACAYMPEMEMMGADFKPLSSDIAALAAPRDPTQPALRPLYCTVGKGAARFQKGWSDFRQQDFVMTAATPVQVGLSASKGSGLSSFQAYFDYDGQKLVFCPVVAGDPDDKIACASLYALEDDLTMGIKRTFDVPDAVRGGAIICGYDSKKRPKL